MSDGISMMGRGHPLIIAHRGASWWAPENTEPAFLLAREIGAGYFELDVQRTKDGVLVVFHDEALARVTNVKKCYPRRVRAPVGEFTFDELRRLNLGAWFNRRFPRRARSAFKEARILKLEEVLSLAGEGEKRPGVFIEIKGTGQFPGMEEEVVRLLQERGWLEQARKGRVVFSSFAPEVLKRLAWLAPPVPRLLLLDAKKEWEKKARTACASLLGPHVSFLLLPSFQPDFLTAAHRAGYPVIPYTVNRLIWIKRMARKDVDGYFTDCPERALLYSGRAGKMDPAFLLQKLGW